MTVEQAQQSLDRFCVERADARLRVIGETRASVAAHAERERLRLMPHVAFPATLRVERRVSAQALVAFRGNRYSVPPELAHASVTVTLLLGAPTIDIATTSGIVIARPRLATEGAGVMVRDHAHVTALDHAALKAFSDAPPHRRKQRIPPGPAARAAAAALTGTPSSNGSDGTVVDLARYAQAAKGRNTLQ